MFLWFLDHELDSDELRFQISEMKRQGSGGFFMHWITGGEPYMSERWLKGLDVIIEEAGRSGLEAWLYDEAWCPSCFAGGRCLAENPEIQLQTIYNEIRDVSAGEEVVLDFDLMKVLGVFALPLHYGEPVLEEGVPLKTELGSVDLAISAPHHRAWGYYDHVEPLPHWRAAAMKDYMWRLRWRAPAGSNWRVYVFCARRRWDWDRMNRLNVLDPEAAEAFLRETHEVYAGRFGKHFGKTIPGIMIDEPKFCPMPWTTKLPELFAERYGDDLISLLPAIFDPSIKNSSVARIHYHRLVSNLFNQNYIRPIAEWCRQHDLLLTGHISPEEDLSQETDLTGSIHCLLNHFDIPGTDLIIQAVGDRQRPALNLGPKMAASVARQQGMERVFTEVGACCEEDLSLEQIKLLVDWHFVHGVNLITFHGLSYSLGGFRKFLTGQTFSVYNNLWPSFQLLSRHIETSCDFLIRYPRNPRLAILKPHTASRALTAPFDAKVLKSRECIDESLIDISWNFLSHQLDFDLLDEDSTGDWWVKGSSLIVGQAEYEIIVIPDCGLISGETAEKLKQFHDNGGKLIIIGRHLKIPFSKDEEKVLCLPGPLENADEAVGIITKALNLPFCLEGKGKEDVLVYHGVDNAGEQGFFLLNLATESVSVNLIYQDWRWLVKLGAGESATVTEKAMRNPVGKAYNELSPILLNGPWRIKKEHINHIPLIASKTILRIEENIKDLRLAFDLDELCELKDALFINGKSLIWDEVIEEKFYDHLNLFLPLPGIFTSNENVIEMRGEKTLTAIIAGNFWAFYESENSIKLANSKNSTEQVSRFEAGAPFSRGGIKFSSVFQCGNELKNGGRLILSGRQGVISVMIDDKPVGDVAWKPDFLDLAPISPGKHSIELAVLGDGVGLLRSKAHEAGLTAEPMIFGL